MPPYPYPIALKRLIQNYPPELQAQVRRDLEFLLNQDRRFKLGELQALFAVYEMNPPGCQVCSSLAGLRKEIDRVMLE